MAMIPIPLDLKEFLKLLSEHHVDYLLIGGYAVSYHGYPRPTGHMDIWVCMSQENAVRIIAALDAFGFGASGLTTEPFVQPDQITRMGDRPFQIEILTSISGLDFADAYAQRVVDIIDGVLVSIISAEHLKINKRASGRLKVLADLESLP
jgi:hypothetical protein